jgi:molybdopterin/thiamine biosynthesis adenylyltransferase
MGFWDDATQVAILNSSVAIGGTGGAGYMFGVEMARIGVQRFTIADPEVFEEVNSNRVIGVTVDTVGQNKATVLSEELKRINPDVKVRVFAEGITFENVQSFLDGSDLVLEATELSLPALGTMICREARRRGIPVLNVEYVGHGAQVTSFDPHGRMTFERMMGISGGVSASLDNIANQTIDTSRYLAYLPPYGDLKTLIAIREGAPLPSNMIGAGQAAQLGVAEAIKHLRQRAGLDGMKPTIAPEVRWIDAYTGKSGVTRHPRLSYYRHLAVAVIRNRLRLHEVASYGPAQRDQRGDHGHKDTPTTPRV